MAVPTTGPTASVRPARPPEAGPVAERVAALQAAAWREAYAPVLPPPALDALAPERLAPVWREAVQRPPSPRHVVLLALAGADVVGFAALAPADDADLEPGAAAELLALAVEPAQRGAGHGSRLLQAVADLLAEVRTPRAVAWVGEHEAALAAFLRGAGWGEDGAARTLDPVGDGSAPLHQRRWATRLADGP